MSKAIKLTKDGLEKLERELEILVTEKRQEIAQKIKEARSFGDLSENSEYDEAMNDQARIESRIAEIEAMLRNVELVSDAETSKNRIGLGSKVTIKNKADKKELQLQVVGSAEANPRETPMKISDECEVGKLLLGKQVGDKIETKNGAVYEILALS